MRIKTLWRVTRRAAQDWWDDNCLRLRPPVHFRASAHACGAILATGRQAGKRTPQNLQR